MEPQGDELPAVQAEALRVARLVDTLAVEALKTGSADAGLLKALLAKVEAVGVLVSADGYSVGESLHIALHELAQSLGNVQKTLKGDNPFDGAASELAVLRLQVLDEIQQPPKPRHGTPSVGFEWQTDIKVEKTEVPPSKTLLKRWPAEPDQPAILRLELDGPDLEFVTAAVTTMAEVRAQVDAIRREVELLRAADYAGHDYYLPEAARSDVTGVVAFPVGHRVHVRHGGDRARGSLQATTARPLDRVRDLLVTYGGATALLAVAQIDGYYTDAPPMPRVAQLLYLVRYYVLCLELGTTDDQGPKVLLPVMSRTDFHSAYLLLDEAERKDFRRCVGYAKPATGDFAWRGTVLAQKLSYKGPTKWKYQGPTIGQWYDSIVAGSPSSLEVEPLDRDNDGEGPRGDHRDLLSPPKGYPAHRRGRHFTYAMGFYGTAEDGSLLFELRQVAPVAPTKEPAAREYTTDTVFDAILEFAARELPTTTATTITNATDDDDGGNDDDGGGGDGAERPTKRRRVATRRTGFSQTGESTT
ncbi:hypothetical protein [Saccharothrix stipae]